MSRKRKLFKALSVFLCVLLLFEFSSGIHANAEGNIEYVFDASSFTLAMKKAKDGDIIIIYGEIKINGSFGSADKTITVRRENEDSRLIAGYGVEVQNIIFDGGNYISGFPMITTQGGFSAENCIFQNCKGEKGSVIGGAVQVETADTTFTGCSFFDNTSVSGGHIAVRNDCSANITDCTFKGGYAKNYGGAISVFTGANCYIDSCVITENEAVNYGGGIGNRSFVQVKNTKLYNNKTQYAGADIGNGIGAIADLQDSIEQLVELFKEDNITPKGWVCDYDFEENPYIPDIEPSQENALLKLDFEVVQPEPENTPETTDPEQSKEPDTPKEPTATDPPTESESTEPPKDAEQQPQENHDGNKTPEQSGSDETKDDTPTESDKKSPEPGTTEVPQSTPSNSENGGSSNNSNNGSTEMNTTTDNSRRTTTNDSNNTSTVNNYYGQSENEPSKQPDVQTIVIPVDRVENGKPIEQTIKIESSPEESVSSDTAGTTLNINVNIGSETAGQQIVTPAQAGISWYQVVVIALLVGILVCLLKRRE